jgi:tRNA nucleotidyltransferase (CCA-adding enzyme)
MSRTVAQGFDELCSRLEITDLQASTVSIRQQNVRDAVKEELIVLDDFLTGSYMRNTMIAPLSTVDIDTFFVLSPEYYKVDGQQYILDKVRDALRKNYAPQVSRNGQAVTIFFKDFEADVVPAFYSQKGGYLIADSVLRQWISTDPKKHIDLWSQANKAHNYMLIPFIKMLKG